MLNFERQQQNYLSMIENSLHLYLPEEGPVSYTHLTLPTTERV